MTGVVTFGLGFTVMVNVCAAPKQPFADGMTVMVAIMGDEVKLVAVNDGILPTPLAANPMLVVLFVQL